MTQLNFFNLMFFSAVHHSIELFHQPTLMHNLLYSLTICLLHYYPLHVSSINIPIFRRKNYIHTASGIFNAQFSLFINNMFVTLLSSTCFENNNVTNILLMNKENCALKLVDEIILITHTCNSKQKHNKSFLFSQ